MFTGIISDIGTIRSIAQDGDLRLEISTKFDIHSIDLGSSICCSGVCLTIIDKGKDWVAVEVSSETLSRTTIDTWRKGTKINLEKALLVGNEIGGHIVSGHVDGVGCLVELTPEKNSVRMLIDSPEELSHLIAEKGSIAIDGVSLTVNKIMGAQFEVNIVKYTQDATILMQLPLRAKVNLEVDMLARYVARLLERK